jgi:hypothetical protein
MKTNNPYQIFINLSQLFDDGMGSFVLDIVVIELLSVGGFPLKEASEHCSQ